MNQQGAGVGRFPCHDIIRAFGENMQVALQRPTAAQRIVEGRRELLAELAKETMKDE